MKNRNQLKLAAAVIVIIILSCSKPLAPEYISYNNFRFEKLGFTNSILATDVKLYNPNKYNLQLKSASVDIYLNDRFLGHSSLDTLIVLVARDTTSFPIRLNASAKDLLKNTAELLLNPNVKIRISGSAKAGRGGFFINVPIAYEGMQKIDF